jgi:hypothetical protein
MINVIKDDSEDLTEAEIAGAIYTKDFEQFLSCLQRETSKIGSYPTAYAQRRKAGVTYYRVRMTDNRILVYQADWLNNNVV